MKAFITAVSLALLGLNGAWGQAQVADEVPIDTLIQAGLPIDGIAGVILSYDFETVREIHRVEADVELERISNSPDAPETATVSLVVGIWNSSEFFFQGDFGDWATVAGNYFVATNTVEVFISRALSRRSVRIAVNMPREGFYQDADILVGLFPEVKEKADSGLSYFKARILGRDPAIDLESLKTFQIPLGPFGLGQTPTYDVTPNVRITTRKIVSIDTQPELSYHPGGTQTNTALTLSWSNKFPGWSIQWDYDPTFPSPQYFGADDIFEQTKNSTPQPPSADAEIYSFEVPRDESGLPRFFRLFYWDFQPYIPRLAIEQAGFGGPPIVPLPQP